MKTVGLRVVGFFWFLSFEDFFQDWEKCRVLPKAGWSKLRFSSVWSVLWVVIVLRRNNEFHSVRSPW